MTWRDAAALFFGGLFLANSTPHFIAGVSGRAFHTPFAKPPFRGVSPPTVNIAWSLCNLALAWVLLVAVGALDLHNGPMVAFAASGFGFGGWFIARSITKMQREAAK
ncbi:MAG: hypothetical protein U0228_31765 [Myxococcaceae bacterium]